MSEKIKKMTPILEMKRAARRLRFHEESHLLTDKMVTDAFGWLSVIYRKWYECAELYSRFDKDSWDMFLDERDDFGSRVPEVKDFKKNLRDLHESVTSNNRPFFFKISLVNKYIKEQKCQEKTKKD